MKKIIAFVCGLLLLTSCINGVSRRIPLEQGDLRVTYSKKHIIIEEIDGFTGAGVAVYKLVKITSNDSTNIQAIEELIKKSK